MSNYTPTSPNTIGRIRTELDKIADAIEDKLDRTPDEGQANQMEADLDVNSNKLLNVGDASLNSDGVNLGQVKEVLENAGVSGGSIISETPPTTPTPGLRWTRCSDMVSFIWYEDDDGGQWIEDNPSVGAADYDEYYSRHTTVAEVESGVFKIGDKLIITDRANAKFEVVAGGTPDGFGVLNAGSGNTAKLVVMNGTHYISAYGAKTTEDASGVVQSVIDSVSEGESIVFDLESITMDSGVSRSAFPDNVTIDLNGCTITANPLTMVGDLLFVLTGDATELGTKTLANPDYTTPPPPSPTVYTYGVSRYVMEDSVGLPDGDATYPIHAEIRSTRAFDPLNNNKETVEVQRVWSFDQASDVFWTDAQSIIAFEAGDTVKFTRLTQGLVIKNGTLRGQDVTNTLLDVKYFNEPRLFNIKVEDCDTVGIRVSHCCGDLVYGCVFQRAGKPTNPDAAYAGRFGYGLFHQFSCYSKVTDCTGYEGWHSFEVADAQRDIVYNNCQALSDGHGFNSHEGAVATTYINCVSRGRLPLLCRARYLKIQGGEYEISRDAATLTFGGWQATVDGASIKSYVSGQMVRMNEARASNYATEPLRPYVSVSFTNNTIEMPNQSQVLVGNGTTDTTTFTGNTIQCKGDTGVIDLRGISCSVGRNDVVKEGAGPIYDLSGLRVLFNNNTISNESGSPTNFDMTNLRETSDFNYSGQHDGVGSSSVLVDSTANFKPNSLIGQTITNTTDGSSGVVTGNTQTTITATLSGGTENDWDAGDNYSITAKYSFTFNNNTFQGAVSRVIRDYIGDASRTEVLAVNNVYNTTFGRVFSGNVTLTSSSNVFSDTYNNITAYSTDQGTVKQAFNDLFLQYSTYLADDLPTSGGSIPTGFVYNNAGSITIK